MVFWSSHLLATRCSAFQATIPHHTAWTGKSVQAPGASTFIDPRPTYHGVHAKLISGPRPQQSAKGSTTGSVSAGEQDV
jgi:hypothetical protein